MASTTMRILAAACGLYCATSDDFTDAQALLQSRVDANSVQPEYARPHVHGWEKAKDQLINGGKQIDSILKDTKKALANLTNVLHVTGELDKKCNLTLEDTEGVKLFSVDNTKLQASTNGIGYRFRKALWDRDLKTIARWGSTIEGVDHGDGWIQVGDCFLPTVVQDVPVLKLQSPHKASVRLATKPASLIEVKDELEGAPVMSYEMPSVTEPPQQLVLARDFGEGEVAADNNGLRIGESIEVKVSGENRSEWIKCVVQSRGENDTYTVYLPHAPPRERKLTKVPFSLLRKPNSVNDDGVLLFFAVSSRPENMDMVKRNVNHLRETYPGKADVFFVHVDAGKGDWTDSDEDWYNKNVQFSSESQLPKKALASSSMLFAQDFYPPQIRLAKALIPQVIGKRNYKWIWMVDEDIDFSVTDLAKLFGDAERTGAMVVGPSVNFEDRLGSKAMSKMYMPGCTQANAMCFMHVPKPACQYRYTNFVEALFPIMRPDAFKEMFVECESCDKQIDRFWCKRLAMKFHIDHEQVCAILDQAAVVHTNGKTLRKWEDVDRSHAGGRDRMDKLIKDYVFDIENIRCVQ